MLYLNDFSTSQTFVETFSFALEVVAVNDCSLLVSISFGVFVIAAKYQKLIVCQKPNDLQFCNLKLFLSVTSHNWSNLEIHIGRFWHQTHTFHMILYSVNKWQFITKKIYTLKNLKATTIVSMRTNL